MLAFGSRSKSRWYVAPADKGTSSVKALSSAIVRICAVAPSTRKFRRAISRSDPATPEIDTKGFDGQTEDLVYPTFNDWH